MSIIKYPGTIREAGLILLVGAVFGLVYTGITGKGLFAPAAPAEPVGSDYVPEYIDIQEMISVYESGGAIVVDARHDFDYELGHIAGAVNLPLKEFEERKDLIRDWPKDALIITYCDGQECNSSIDLATKFSEAGFSNVRFFFGGWSEWVATGGPAEKMRDE